MRTPSHVLIIGAGAIGSLMAGLLARSGIRVTLVTRDRAQATLLQTRGITLSGLAQFQASVEACALEDLATVQGVDLVLVAVKAPALDHLRPILENAQAPIIILQNGWGQLDGWPDDLRSRCSQALVYLSAIRREMGHIAWTGQGEIVVAPQAEILSNALNAAGLSSRVDSDIVTEAWCKLLVNSVVNPLTALFAIPNGALLKNTDLLAIADDIVAEGIRVGLAMGLPLSLDLAIARYRRVCELTERNHSSMWQDIEHGKPTEIDFINGAIVREGLRYGILTPVNQTMVRLIKFLEFTSVE